MVRGGPQVRFHEGSTRVPPGFREGSTGLKRAPHAVGDITRAYLVGRFGSPTKIDSRKKVGTLIRTSLLEDLAVDGRNPFRAT